MFWVDECGVIHLTKGDTAQLDVVLEDCAGNSYLMETGDVLTLTVREKATADSKVLLQTTSNTSSLTLSSADTSKLPVGKQSYDVQLTKKTGERYTVAGATSILTSLKNFHVLPEVTID